MRLLSLTVAAFVAVVSANPEMVQVQDYSSPLQNTEASPTTAAATTTGAVDPTATSTAETTQSTSTWMTPQEYEYHHLPQKLKQFIMDMSPKPQLQERQNAAIGGGAAPSQTFTQLSPTTIYDIGAGATTYVQTFAPTPSAFPAPAAGTVGMGTIQGKYGTTRSYSNSNAAPTAHVDSRVILAVAGGIGAGMIL